MFRISYCRLLEMSRSISLKSQNSLPAASISCCEPSVLNSLLIFYILCFVIIVLYTFADCKGKENR